MCKHLQINCKNYLCKTISTSVSLTVVKSVHRGRSWIPLCHTEDLSASPLLNVLILLLRLRGRDELDHRHEARYGNVNKLTRTSRREDDLKRTPNNLVHKQDLSTRSKAF